MSAGPENAVRERDALGIVLVVVSAVFIGIMPNAAKLAYADGTNPLALLVVRSGVGVIAMAATLRIMGAPLAIPRDRVGSTALAGMALFVTAGGGMSSVAYIDVSLASVLFFTYPFFVAAINHVRGQTRLGVADIACMVLAFGGLALALGASLEGQNPTGIVLAMAASLGVTVMVLTTTDNTLALGALRANLHMTLWAGIYFAILAAVGPMSGLMEPMRFPLSAGGWFWLIVAGVTFTASFIAFFAAAAILGATRTSVLSILEPIMMIAFAILLVGEMPSPLRFAGVALVLGSLLALELVPRRG